MKFLFDTVGSDVTRPQMESATGVEQSWVTDDEWTIAPEETINRRVK